MAIPQLEENLNIISLLDDEPNDVGGLTASELKAKFDEGNNIIKNYINGTLIPMLENYGVERVVKHTDGEGMITYIRLNSDKVLETSVDGINWESTGSSGHIIESESGELPQRSRLKFLNTIIEDNGTETVIHGMTGPQGPQGVQGIRGLQGEKGEKGDRGYLWYPSVDTLGNLTFTLTDNENVPPTYNIRGPQGVQGVQGPQGVVGPTGPQGIQGVRGPQGIQGEQGEIGPRGETGATGPQGPTGPQGLTGPAGKDGTSLYIEDVYSTLAALRNALPTGNEKMYMVSENGECYIWSELSNDWISVGALQGPIGPQGPAGANGATGPKGDTGPRGPQGVQGPQGEQGAEGPQGIQGLQGPQGVEGKSAYSSAVTAGFTGTEAEFNEMLAGIGNKLDYNGDGKDLTPTFAKANTFVNIQNGEKMSTLLGKIAKGLDRDSTPTENSTNLITSGGVAEALANVKPKIPNHNFIKNAWFKNFDNVKASLRGTQIYQDANCTTPYPNVQGASIMVCVPSGSNYKWAEKDGSNTIYIKASDVVDASTIENWQFNSGVANVDSNGLHTNASADTTWIIQYVKCDIGKTYTLSVNVDGVISSTTVTLESTSTTASISLGGSNVLMLSYDGDIGNSWYISIITYSTALTIKSVKLEMGNTSTLAYETAESYDADWEWHEANFGIPVGMYTFTPSETMSDEWLLCNGSTFSANSYPKLAQIFTPSYTPISENVPWHSDEWSFATDGTNFAYVYASSGNFYLGLGTIGVETIKSLLIGSSSNIKNPHVAYGNGQWVIVGLSGYYLNPYMWVYNSFEALYTTSSLTGGYEFCSNQSIANNWNTNFNIIYHDNTWHFLSSHTNIAGVYDTYTTGRLYVNQSIWSQRELTGNTIFFNAPFFCGIIENKLWVSGYDGRNSTYLMQFFLLENNVWSRQIVSSTTLKQNTIIDVSKLGDKYVFVTNNKVLSADSLSNVSNLTSSSAFYTTPLSHYIGSLDNGDAIYISQAGKLIKMASTSSIVEYDLGFKVSSASKSWNGLKLSGDKFFVIGYSGFQDDTSGTTGNYGRIAIVDKACKLPTITLSGLNVFVRGK